jgi:hypothetical protein
VHWTSPYRVIAGINPYQPAAGTGITSSFTIRDEEAARAFLDILRAQYPRVLAWRRRPPMWHLDVLDVKPSYGDISEPFWWTAGDFKRVSCAVLHCSALLAVT